MFTICPPWRRDIRDLERHLIPSPSSVLTLVHRCPWLTHVAPLAAWYYCPHVAANADTLSGGTLSAAPVSLMDEIIILPESFEWLISGFYPQSPRICGSSLQCTCLHAFLEAFFKFVERLLLLRSQRSATLFRLRGQCTAPRPWSLGVSVFVCIFPTRAGSRLSSSQSTWKLQDRSRLYCSNKTRRSSSRYRWICWRSSISERLDHLPVS